MTEKYEMFIVNTKCYERKVLGCWMLVVSLPQAGHVLSEAMVLPSQI